MATKTKAFYGTRWEDKYVEIVNFNGKKTFMVFSKNEVKHYDGLGDFVVPEIIPWEIPPAIDITDVGLRTTEQVWGEIKAFIKKHLHLKEDGEYGFLAAWIMCTWIKEQLDVFPYVHFIGPKGSGKTRGQEILKALSYRAYKTSDPSEAALARDIQHKKVTVFIDELEYNDLKEKNLIGILNAGYKPGDVYTRMGEDKQTVEYFKVEGFRSFSSRDAFIDTLESRCLTINMESTTRPLPPINKADVERLRRLLLAFRTEHLFNDIYNQYVFPYFVINTVLSLYVTKLHIDIDKNNNNDIYDINIIINNNNNSKDKILTTEEITLINESVKVLSGRLGEVTHSPLKIVSQASTCQEEIEYLLKLISNHIMEEQTTIESDVVTEIAAYVKENQFMSNPTPAEIAERLNTRLKLAKNEQFTSGRIGRLMKRLGFKQRRTGSRREYIIEAKTLKKVIERFAPELLDKEEA